MWDGKENKVKTIEVDFFCFLGDFATLLFVEGTGGFFIHPEGLLMEKYLKLRGFKAFKTFLLNF